MRTALLAVWVTFWVFVFATAIVWLLRRAYRAEPLGVKGTVLIVAMAPVRWVVKARKRRGIKPFDVTPERRAAIRDATRRPSARRW